MADTSIGKAYVQIVPKAEGISGQMENLLSDGAEDSGKSAGLSFGKKMVGALGKIGIGAAVGKIFKDSIAEGANLQQSFGGLDTLYGDASDTMKQYAYEAAQAGISANDYAEQAVSFGAALKSAFGGDTQKAAEAANTAIMDMTDNAAKMGTPIESIQNAYQGFAKGQYNMLDNLKLGYGGTKEEMERLLADASKLSGVEYNIDNLGDVYEAIHVIQEDLGLTGVAAEEAATTFSGSFGAMKAAAANVLGNMALGESIQPSLQELGSSIKTFLVDNAIPMIGNVAAQIPTVLANLPSFLGDLIPGIISAGAELVANLAESIVENIPTFVAGIGTMFGKIWDFIETIDWGSVGSRIVGLIGKAWDALVETAGIIWDGVVGIFTGEIEFPDLAAVASGIWNRLTTIAGVIWDAVVAFFTSAIDWPDLSAAAQEVWNAITGVAETIWETITGVFTGDITFADLSEAATEVWGTLITLAGSVWDSIKGVLTKLFDFTSLDEKASAAWNTLTGIASGVWDTIKAALTAVFDFTSLDEKATAAWGSLVTLAGSFWESIKGVFGKSDVVFSTLSDLAETAWSGLSGVAETVWSGIKDVFGSWPEDFQWPDFGKLIGDALKGLKKAAEDAWNWIMGLFGGGDEEEAVKSVQGSTDEMASALADANLKINDVDLSSITLANEHVKNTALSWIRIFDNLKLKIPTIDVTSLSSALRSIKAYVENYKAAMNFNWTLPTLHGYLPVISVSMRDAKSSDGRTSVSYPELSVSSLKWFKDGGIFTDPTVIGIGDSKGPEAALPLDMLWRKLDTAFERHDGGGTTVNNYFTVDGAQDPEAWAMGAARAIKRELRMT